MLHCVDEVPFRDIARAPGLSLTGALTHAHRARREIIARLPGLAPYLAEN